MTILLKFWREGLIALLAIALLASGGLVMGKQKALGQWQERTKVALASVSARDKRIAELNAQAEAYAKASGQTYARCEAADRDSDSSAFQRGVLAGRAMTRREQCTAKP